jgi:hypothetical protein
VAEQRYRVVLEVLEAQVPMVEVAKRRGATCQSVHHQVRRYLEGGLGATRVEAGGRSWVVMVRAA